MNSERGLPRILSLFDLSVLSSASMGLAYSLASTMGPMVAVAGSAAPLVLLGLTLCMACIAAAYADLSRAYPHAGSSYAWILKAFGLEAGNYAAWLLLMANIFGVLATAIPAGTYTLALMKSNLVDSPLAVAEVGAIWVGTSGVLLAAGLRPTAGVTAILLIGEMSIITVSALVSLLQPNLSFGHTLPAMPLPNGGIAVSGIVTAMVLAIWMVDGWELSAATSEEANHTAGPGRGGLIALGTMSMMLLIAMIAYMHLVGVAALSKQPTDALALVGERLGGLWQPVIILTVLVSASASLWTTMLYLTRSLFAMGRDHILPFWFAGLDSDHTPRRALIVVTITTVVLTLLAGGLPTVNKALNLALSGSGVFLGLIFVGTASAAIRLLAKRQRWLRTVITPAFGVLSISLLIVEQILQGDAALRLFSTAALFIGIPVAAWQGWRLRRRLR